MIRLPFTAAAVLALIFSAGVLGFSIGRDLTTSNTIAKTR
jgi:hypothetical protein